MILHYPWLKVKSKPFSRAKNVKKLIFLNSRFNSDFSDPVRASRDFRVGLFALLYSVLDNFALKSKLVDFTPSRGFLKRSTLLNFLQFSSLIVTIVLSNFHQVFFKFIKNFFTIFLKLNFFLLRVPAGICGHSQMPPEGLLIVAQTRKPSLVNVPMCTVAFTARVAK